MIYRLLGELEIGPLERPLSLPGGHALVVLAALLINANQRMSKTELLVAAWGSPEVEEAQLHKAISALRNLLRQLDRGSDLITHARHGYEIRAANDALDVLAFRRLLHQADEARAGSRTAEEIRLFGEALALWRGQHPLANVPSSAFEHEVGSLLQRRKRAASRLFDLEIARGGYERILDLLAGLHSQHPEDERLSEQVMVVQYRCGHVTDATAAYESHGAAVADHTGGTPKPALRDLYYAIASGEDAVVAAAEAGISRRSGIVATSAATGRGQELAVPRQLPPDPADFVGREELLAETSWLLTGRADRALPIVVISGPGGIGKTALARRVAHRVSGRYPGGQLYLDMRGTSGEPADPGEVLAQFLRAFGVQEVPVVRSERVSLFRTLLADRQVLIVLDDVAGGAQVRDLIPANPGCAVLITARRRLPEVEGAHHTPRLTPLSQALSKELFLRIAAGANLDLRPEITDVDKVTVQCGGLPLALRIAAALRVRDHPRPTADLADLLARHGHGALTYADLSVGRSIGAGFEQLSREGRQLFTTLGLLRLPTFGPWTAAALSGGTDLAARDALSALAASHMVEPEPGPRYSFHDLTREYAAGQATASCPDDADRLAIQAAAYRALLTLTRQAHAALYGGDFEVVHSDVPDWDAPPAILAEATASPREWFTIERLNIRAAVIHCAELGLTDLCWDLATSAHEFYTLGDHFDDWQATHAAALRACQEAGNRRGEGVVLACFGQAALVASKRAGASGVAELERAVELLTECGDAHGLAIAQRTLASALRRNGQLARPLALLRQAQAGYEAAGDVVGRWQAMRFIGQTYLGRGQADEALAALREAQQVADQLSRRRLDAQTSYWIGQASLSVGDLEAAQAAFATVGAVYSDGAGVGRAYALHGFGELALRAGKLDDAQGYYGKAAEFARDGGDAVLEGRVSLSVAELFGAQGQPAGRRVALDQAIACFAACGAAQLQARALAAAAAALHEDGDSAGAAATKARICELYESLAVPAEDRIYGGPLSPP